MRAGRSHKAINAGVESGVEEKQYVALPSAAKFHESHAHIKFLCGPVGSGKSTAALLDFMFLCLEADRPMRGLVIRETKQQLQDSTLMTAKEWLGHCSEFTSDSLLLTLTGFDGKERIHRLDFRAARRAADAQQFQSTEYAWIWLEEVVPAFDIKNGVIGGGIPRGVFEICVMRQRQQGAHREHIVVTFNPPNKFHWVYQEAFKPSLLERQKLGIELFHQPARENAANLPPGYYERVEAALGPEMAKRFVDGEVVTLYPGRRVYPEFLEELHFEDHIEPEPGIGAITMHDFGRTPNTLIAQMLPNGRLLVLKEIQLWDANTAKMIEQLQMTLNNMGLNWIRGWGDPSGRDTRSETDDTTSFSMLDKAGFPIQPGAMTFTHRREVVKARAQRHVEGHPAILIDREQCPLLSEGLLGGYRYNITTDGLPSKDPMKNEFSHGCNSLEYGLSGEYGLTGEAKRLAEEDERRAGGYGFDPLAIDERRSGSWMSR